MNRPSGRVGWGPWVQVSSPDPPGGVLHHRRRTDRGCGGRQGCAGHAIAIGNGASANADDYATATGSGDFAFADGANSSAIVSDGSLDSVTVVGDDNTAGVANGT
jgi:hypothetical protein